MQFPILIGLRRSRILSAGLIFIGVSVLGLGACFLPTWPLKLVFCVLTLGYCFWVWQKITPKISDIRLERNGSILIRSDHQQAFLPVVIQPNSTVHPWLTVFQVKSESAQAFTLIATVDTLKRQDFRRLRVFLRWRSDASDGLSASEPDAA